MNKLIHVRNIITGVVLGYHGASKCSSFDFSTSNFFSLLSVRSSSLVNIKENTESKPSQEQIENERKNLRLNISKTRRIVKKLVNEEAVQEQIGAASSKLKELEAKLSLLECVHGKKDVTALKTPRGTRDYGPEEMMVRHQVLDHIASVFKSHGAVNIDTPVFELRDILKSKYGEDSKSIFNLVQEPYDEALSLRFDLTVPFARYLVSNKICNFKRYQIAKAYRRDDPVMTKGRYREFIQCDFDIAGNYERMVPDVECVRIGCEVLNTLNLSNFRIKINHRLLLDGLFQVCGIEKSKFRSICSAIDKLDKRSWEEIRDEMREKGLSNTTIDQIGRYIRRNGGSELVQALETDDFLTSSELSRRGLEDIKLFLHYGRIYQIFDKVSVDLSLARGLDYYTGIIYEFVLESNNHDHELIGSVAAGGRYDNLVRMCDPNDKYNVPCVGISIGAERLFPVIGNRMKKNSKKVRVIHTDVYVASVQKNQIEERMKICAELWDNGIRAEMSYKNNVRLLHQLQHSDEHAIPYVIIFGDDELEKGVLRLKDFSTREEVDISRDKLVSELKKRLHERSRIGGCS